MSILPKLRKSLRDKSIVYLKIDLPDDDHFSGVVTHVTSDFVALQQESDFEFNGTAIVPLNRVQVVRNNANDKCMTRIMQHNGQIDKLKVPAWLNHCVTLPDVFHQLLKRDIWPSVDIADKQDSWFFIGQLTVVEELGFCIRAYTSTGRWTKPQGLRMQDVSKVEFNTKYEKHFGRYMKDCAKPA